MTLISLTFVFMPLFLGLISVAIKLTKYRLLYRVHTIFVLIIAALLFLYCHLHQDVTLYQHFGNWARQVGIEFSFNYESSVMLLYGSILFCIHAYIIKKEEIKNNIVGFLMILQAALNGIILSSDLFNTYVFIELSCITCYGLYTYEQEPKSLKATFDYLIINSVAGLLFLLSIFMIYNYTGNLNMHYIASVISVEKYSKILSMAYLTFLFGFVIKIGIIPLHKNIQNLYKESNSIVTMITSNTVSKIYIVALIKITLVIFGFRLFESPYVAHLMVFLVAMSTVFFAISSYSEGRNYNFIYNQIIYQNLLYLMFLPFVQEGIFTKNIKFSILFNGISFMCILSIIRDIECQLGKSNISFEDISTAIQESLYYRYILLFNILSISGLPLSYMFIQKLITISHLFLINNGKIGIMYLILNFIIFVINTKVLQKILSIKSTKEDAERQKIKTNPTVTLICIAMGILQLMSFGLVFLGK